MLIQRKNVEWEHLWISPRDHERTSPKGQKPAALQAKTPEAKAKAKAKKLSTGEASPKKTTTGIFCMGKMFIDVYDVIIEVHILCLFFVCICGTQLRRVAM